MYNYCCYNFIPLRLNDILKNSASTYAYISAVTIIAVTRLGFLIFGYIKMGTLIKLNKYYG